MPAILKSSLQNLSPLPTSFKVEPLAKPKPWLRHFVNMGPELRILFWSCPNLNQFFLVTVLILPKNSITILTGVLELCYKQTHKQTSK